MFFTKNVNMTKASSGWWTLNSSVSCQTGFRPAHHQSATRKRCLCDTKRTANGYWCKHTASHLKLMTYMGVNPGGWVSWPPWKYAGVVRVCFDHIKVSVSLVQNCCWITLQVSHHQGWKTGIKNGMKIFFLEAPETVSCLELADSEPHVLRRMPQLACISIQIYVKAWKERWLSVIQSRSTEWSKTFGLFLYQGHPIMAIGIISF